MNAEPGLEDRRANFDGKARTALDMKKARPAQGHATGPDACHGHGRTGAVDLAKKTMRLTHRRSSSASTSIARKAFVQVTVDMMRHALTARRHSQNDHVIPNDPCGE